MQVQDTTYTNTRDVAAAVGFSLDKILDDRSVRFEAPATCIAAVKTCAVVTSSMNSSHAVRSLVTSEITFLLLITSLSWKRVPASIPEQELYSLFQITYGHQLTEKVQCHEHIPNPISKHKHALLTAQHLCTQHMLTSIKHIFVCQSSMTGKNPSSLSSPFSALNSTLWLPRIRATVSWYPPMEYG